MGGGGGGVWGPLGPPWAPWGPLGPLGPLGAQIRPGWVVSIFKKITKIEILAFFGSKIVKKKLRLRGRDPPSDLRAEIWRNSALVASKTVGWRPNW